MSDDLTPKQQRFIEEYLIDLNATQAAIRAGYAPSGARTEGSRLLANADIARAIEAGRREISERSKMDAQWVLEKLRAVAERSLQHESVKEFNHASKRLEETGEFQFDSMGANRALELIGKHLGMFSDKLDVTVRKPVEEWTDEELNGTIAEIEARTGGPLPPGAPH